MQKLSYRKALVDTKISDVRYQSKNSLTSEICCLKSYDSVRFHNQQFNNGNETLVIIFWVNESRINFKLLHLKSNQGQQ
jgi:hypothetical protein